MDTNILDLIPQRPPMVMLDGLAGCEGNAAHGYLEIKEDNVFSRNGYLEESGMIEALAQTAAARTGWLAMNAARVEKVRIPVGVIGSVKDFRLFFHPKTGDTLETTIEVVHEFMNASVVKGIARVDSRVACEAELKIFLVEDQQDKGL